MGFEFCQKPKSNLLSHGIFVQGFVIPNLVNKYKNIFLGKRGKPWSFPKTFSVYWSFLSICFEHRQKPKPNLLSHEILVQGFIMPNWFDQEIGNRWMSIERKSVWIVRAINERYVQCFSLKWSIDSWNIHCIWN